MTKFSPNILTTFYWFSDTLLCTLQHIKNLAHTFFVSARYRRFSLSTWSKMKNFDPDHKSKFIHFLKNKQFYFYGLGQNFSFLTMLIVKICDILPKRKTMRQIFYILQSTWKCIRKSLKSCENVEGKISHFCLGPKTWLGYYDPRFDLQLQIFCGW